MRFPFLKFLAATSGLASAAAMAQTIPDDLELVPVITSGSVSQPVAVRHAGDGSGRLFIVEQGGTIRILRDGVVQSTPFLTINASTPGGFTSGGERGLLGLAFHPQFASNGRLYINYTASGGHTKIVEYQVSTSNPDLVDTGTRRELLHVNQPSSNHNGGNLLFGPDGYLYIGMGDGGGANDQWGTYGNGQNLNTLLGKMLRIDVDVQSSHHAKACGGSGGNIAYGIPADNPFASTPDSYCAEIVYYGLRNPWRWSFDRQTGDLLIGDVGQNVREEVDFVPFASLNQVRNFGWRCFEASASTGLACPGTLAFPHTPPILEYMHTGGHCSITGGYRYRGPIKGLRGAYIYADYCSRRIWFATESGGTWNSQMWSAVASGSITSFGEDEEGNVYVVRHGGNLMERFHSASSMPGTFVVMPVAGPGGRLDPDMPQEVEKGDTVTFDVIPDEGYVIGTVEGCGGVLAGNGFTTAPVTADCTVTATFEVDPDIIFRDGFESAGR